MMSVKEKIEYVIKEYGVKKNFIARGIDISPSEFSMFLTGNRDLKPDQESKVRDLFKKYNGLPFEL
ncbi:hypothetical protein [Paenibacillus sp. FSL H3-0286]|uniref:hypothetical protein n=1 Tax=Paenibacillus sp. FSL H3-0286 TaxID=2921427 RepID=UPI0032444110